MSVSHRASRRAFGVELNSHFERRHIMKRHWQVLGSLFLGSWLVVAPFIIPRTLGDVAIFNDSLIVGALVQVTALAAVVRPNAWKEWAVLVLAAWSIASSYFFDYGVLLNGLHLYGHFSIAGSLFITGLLMMIDATIGLYRQKSIREKDRPIEGLTSTKRSRFVGQNHSELKGRILLETAHSVRGSIWRSKPRQVVRRARLRWAQELRQSRPRIREARFANGGVGFVFFLFVVLWPPPPP